MFFSLWRQKATTSFYFSNVMVSTKQKQDNPKTSGFSKISAKGKIHRNTSLPQETRETSNKWPNFTTKATRKRGSEEPQD